MKTLKELVESVNKFYGSYYLLHKDIKLKENISNGEYAIFEGENYLMGTDNFIAEGEIAVLEAFPEGYLITDEIINYYDEVRG